MGWQRGIVASTQIGALRTTRRARNCFCLAAVLLLPALAAPTSSPTTNLDRGFRLLYDLKFDQAQSEFQQWQAQHPDDPFGFVSEAAGALFSEFNRLGILESQFYESDKSFFSRKKFTPDPAIHQKFENALDRAETIGRARILKDPRDTNALFALTLANGLRADYAALIDRSNLTALKYTRQASQWGEKLLAIDATNYDVYLARGFTRYIVGSMAAPVRWLLRLGGVEGDKQAGIEDLKLTAEKGRYLAPYARILLALAYVRSKDHKQARELLSGLDQEFPNNPLYRKEISRLETAP